MGTFFHEYVSKSIAILSAVDDELALILGYPFDDSKKTGF